MNFVDLDGRRQWQVNPTYKGESRKIGDGVHVNPVIGDNILLDPQKIDAL